MRIVARVLLAQVFTEGLVVQPIGGPGAMPVGPLDQVVGGAVEHGFQVGCGVLVRRVQRVGHGRPRPVLRQTITGGVGERGQQAAYPRGVGAAGVEIGVHRLTDGFRQAVLPGRVVRSEQWGGRVDEPLADELGEEKGPSRFHGHRPGDLTQPRRRQCTAAASGVVTEETAFDVVDHVLLPQELG